MLDGYETYAYVPNRDGSGRERVGTQAYYACDDAPRVRAKAVLRDSISVPSRGMKHRLFVDEQKT